MKEIISKKSKGIKFDKVGYYAIGLIILAFLGFWPTYFSNSLMVLPTSILIFIFIFAMASMWIALLILQPFSN